jgi:hypothetical protein
MGAENMVKCRECSHAQHEPNPDVFLPITICQHPPATGYGNKRLTDLSRSCSNYRSRTHNSVWKQDIR